MKFKFTCRICGKRGSQENTSITPFVFAYRYADSGLEHDCLYHRTCGAVHDTVGTVLGGLKAILSGGFPSNVVAAYNNDRFQRKIEIGEICVIHQVVARSMIVDERLSPEWEKQ